jgi:hypothetical protein
MSVSSVNGVNFNVWEKGVGVFYRDTIAKNLAAINSQVNSLRGKILSDSLLKIQSSIQTIHETVSKQTTTIENSLKNINQHATTEIQTTLDKTQTIIYDVHQKTLDALRIQVKRLSGVVHDSGRLIMDKTGKELTTILNLIDVEAKEATNETKERIDQLRAKIQLFRDDFFDLTFKMIEKTFKVSQDHVDVMIKELNETTAKSYRLFIFLGIFFIITKWGIAFWYPKDSSLGIKESVKEMMLPHLVVVPISVLLMVVIPSIEFIQIGNIKDIGVLGILWQYSFVMIIYGVFHFILFFVSKIISDEKVSKEVSLLKVEKVVESNFKVEEVFE